MAAPRVTLCVLILLFATLLLLESRDVVAALKCYQCGIEFQRPCNDPFKVTSSVVNCTALAGQVCVKTKLNNNVLVRECAPLPTGQNIGCVHDNTAGQISDICFCNDKDFCNSAPRTTLTTFTFMSACLLTTFTYGSQL